MKCPCFLQPYTVMPLQIQSQQLCIFQETSSAVLKCQTFHRRKMCIFAYFSNIIITSDKI